MSKLSINHQPVSKKPNKFTLNLSHRAIIIWLSLAAFIHNIVMNGSMNVIISSLQKEFYLSSRDTGIYISVYDIGSLISSLIIPVLGSHGSKPKWIAFGMFMLCVGCFVNVLPHFIRPKTSLEMSNSSFVGFNDVELCHSNDNLTDIDYNECAKQKESVNGSDTNKFRFDNLKYLLYASNVINGFSSASMTTLAFSYIEDISPESSSALYESIYYATGAFGVGVGFMVTSLFLNIHNDIDSYSQVPKWMKPDHPNWVGAWWLPFIIFGALSFLFAILIFLFPKRASNSENEHEAASNTHTNTTPNPTVDGLSIQFNETDQLNSGDGEHAAHGLPNSYEVDNTLLNTVKEAGSTLSLNRSIAGAAAATVFLQSTDYTHTNGTANNHHGKQSEKLKTKEKFRRTFHLAVDLLKNPVFVFILIASAIEGLLQNSFLAFASLFLEYQYRIASGTASFILGLLSIPPLILGSLLSGLLIKKFQWQMRSCLAFLSIVLFLNLILYSGFFVHCKEPNILLNTHTNDYLSKLTATTDLDTNLTTIKNYNCYKTTDLQCNCNENLYKPVCLLDNNAEYIFQTACIAGCKSYNVETSTYSNCTYAECMLNDYKSRDLLSYQNSTFDDQSVTLTNGLCSAPKSCKSNLIISYFTIFLVMFFTALIYIPYIKVTIGCTSTPEINAIALGIKQLAMTGIGTIPGPIIFGSFIDLTCKYWYTDCLNQKVCKIYSNKRFSFTFGILGIGFKTICWISVFISFLCSRLRKRTSNNSYATNEKS